MEIFDPLANLKAFGEDLSHEIKRIEEKEDETTDPSKKMSLASKKSEKEVIRREIVNAVKTHTLLSKESDSIKQAITDENRMLIELSTSKTIVAKTSHLSSKKDSISSLKSRKSDIEKFSAPTEEVEKNMGDVRGYCADHEKKVASEIKKLEAMLEGYEDEFKGAKKNLASLKSEKDCEAFKRRVMSIPGKIETVKSNMNSLQKKKGELDSIKDGAILDSVGHYLKKCGQIDEDLAISRIQENNRKSQRVDLCFLIDGTGSMDAWIDKTKEKTLEITTEVKETYKETKFRIAVVIYRDFDMGHRSFDILNFSDNQHAVPEFLTHIKADGGDDEAEDINGGFQKVLKELCWENMTKVLIHFADAPCHGPDFGSSYDSHPHPPSDMDWQVIFREIKSLGIDYNFMRINSSTDVMTTEFTRLWNSAGRYFGTNQKKIEFTIHSITDSTTEFVAKIKSAITDSISRSLSYMRTGGHNGKPRLKKRVDEVIAEEDEDGVGSFSPPDWSIPKTRWLEKQGLIISVSIKPIEEILLHGFKIFEGEWDILVQPKPFAKGSFNVAYAACHAVTGHKVIAKKPESVNENLLKLDLKKKGIAISLVSNFNRDLKKLKHFRWARLFFIQTFLFKSRDDPEDLWLLEGYIDGEFKKYSNNLDEIDSTQEIRHLTAFAHYSYQKSNGNYLVTDFQGVGSFLLTDPALHSKTKEFIDSGDFGTEGFIRFFSKHQCNDICRGLKLEKPKLKLVECEKWVEKAYLHEDKKIKRKCWILLCNNELKTHQKQYCSECDSWIQKKKQIKCRICKKSYEYAPYYYQLSALKEPKKCKECGKHKKRSMTDLFGDEDEEECEVDDY